VAGDVDAGGVEAGDVGAAFVEAGLVVPADHDRVGPGADELAVVAVPARPDDAIVSAGLVVGDGGPEEPIPTSAVATAATTAGRRARATVRRVDFDDFAQAIITSPRPADPTGPDTSSPQCCRRSGRPGHRTMPGASVG
jgi:hypothetical protein